MGGWARVEEADPEWKARWEERERRFFAHDVNALRGGGKRLEIRAGPGREVIGQAQAAEYEIRIVDRDGHYVLDVRRGFSRWPREVFRHQVEQIGTIRKSPVAWLVRPPWTLVDGDGHPVAVLRERTVATTVSRRLAQAAGNLVTRGGTTIAPSNLTVWTGRAAVGEIADGGLDLGTDQSRLVDRRLVVAALVAITLDPRGY
jgi:hypothetical protein